ncbi:MAG: Flp pilus assembly complex ATPase component TadA, partial [Lentisphaeria bacterium]|nr:Flp pilus assembly complex ATPase component TadA [Lentisphaeria bacterium]
MFEINIIKPDEPMTTASLQPGIYRIGKSPASHIQLNSPEVSSRHAVLNVQEGSVTVSDVGSTNGTFVDGERIDPETEITLDSGVELKIGAKIIIKIFDPSIPREEPEPELDDEPQEDLAPLEEGEPVNAKSSEGRIARADREDMIMLSGIRWEYRKVAQEIKQSVHAELLKRMNLKNLTLSGADPEEIKKQALETITIILKELSSQIPRGVDISILEEELVNEAVALGPLERLLADESVTEVMVNGYESVYIEKEGLLRRTDLTFADNNQVITVIERIVAPLGRRIDESSPMVDARLPDGSRVNAIIPPLAIDGPSLTIRKFSKKAFTVDDLINFGSLTGDIAEFLKLAVLLRKNILISGGTGSGKTSLLNVVSNFLPNTERIVTIEDAAELRINKDHVVRLEARPPNIEGRGEIAIRDLVRNSLRMRPDRIVIGECRGGEALDMLQAMNT